MHSKQYCFAIPLGTFVMKAICSQSQLFFPYFFTSTRYR